MPPGDPTAHIESTSVKAWYWSCTHKKSSPTAPHLGQKTGGWHTLVLPYHCPLGSSKEQARLKPVVLAAHSLSAHRVHRTSHCAYTVCCLSHALIRTFLGSPGWQECDEIRIFKISIGT